MTDAQWEDLVRRVYAEERRRGTTLWHDPDGDVAEHSTEDQLTFGAWRAAIESMSTVDAAVDAPRVPYGEFKK